MPTRYPSAAHAELWLNVDKLMKVRARQDKLFKELRITLVMKEAKDMTDGRSIEWTRELRNGLRRAYNKSVKAETIAFEYRGDEYLTNYAKYLLEFLDSRIG